MIIKLKAALNRISVDNLFSLNFWFLIEAIVSVGVSNFVFRANEEQERDAAMASALAFLFKQFSYTNPKNNLLERCSAFNAKEKNKFQMFSKPSKKAGVY